MKKIIKILVAFVIFTSICGCQNNSSMENINIYTTAYPIEYVVDRLYGKHSNIKSIYPNGADINNYELTDVLLSEYSNTDMFIFNGLSKEQNYVKPMLKENKNLKIIDVSSDIKNDNGMEELWLDPSHLLTLANNVKKGFQEYIGAKYLINEINENYENLKVDLTNLEAKYRQVIRYSKNNTIVISDDIFQFLNNYGINVISLDKDNENYEKNLINVKNLIKNGNLKYIYLKDTENKNDEINNLIQGSNIQLLKLNTLSTLTDEQRNNANYLTLINENLEMLKKQLYNI